MVSRGDVRMTEIIRYKGKDLTLKQWKEELTKQPMPEPHTKDKVWEEKPIESETEKIIFVHDNIEGKRCQVCDKELKLEKIFWYTEKALMTALEPSTQEIAKGYQTKVFVVQYGLCSKRCRETLKRILKKKYEETQAQLKNSNLEINLK